MKNKKILLKDLKPEEIVKRAKAGEAIRSIHDPKRCLYYLEGLFVEYYNDEIISISSSAALHCDEYTFEKDEEEEKFKVKHKGIYELRNGEKVCVYDLNEHYTTKTFPIYGFLLENPSKELLWTRDGFCSYEEDDSLAWDIVREIKIK